MTNPYPGRFLELLAVMAPDGSALDCGSGARTGAGIDRRIVSFDRIDAPGVVCGDITELPWGDGTFDVVLSQAVLEHVTDPQAAVDEMVRVLRPGGVLYAEAAWLQPGHMLPDHYWGITAQGLGYLCRALNLTGVGTFNNLAAMFDWLGKAAGLDRENRVYSFGQFVNEVQGIEADLPAEAFDLVSMASWCEGVKP